MNKRLIAFNKISNNIFVDLYPCTCGFDPLNCKCILVLTEPNENKNINGFIIKRILKHKKWSKIFSNCYKYTINKKKYKLILSYDLRVIYPYNVKEEKRK